MHSGRSGATKYGLSRNLDWSYPGACCSRVLSQVRKGLAESDRVRQGIGIFATYAALKKRARLIEANGMIWTFSPLQ